MVGVVRLVWRAVFHNAEAFIHAGEKMSKPDHCPNCRSQGRMNASNPFCQIEGDTREHIDGWTPVESWRCSNCWYVVEIEGKRIYAKAPFDKLVSDGVIE